MSELEKIGIPSEAADRWEAICSLSEEELRERSNKIRDELRPHVTKQEKLPGGLLFEFIPTPELRGRLEELIELERRCCGPLRFTLSETPTTLRLEVKQG